uniref:RRM domain-containing protein n=1 Tax=Amphilophus citrinellus TaxID=61819 RepID=A0A3Q0T9I9_AMPCI
SSNVKCCPQLRSRVVVVKYDRKPLSNKTLFAFAERFGCLREHLILKNKAFLEMSTHEEALDVVNYYKQHPASLYDSNRVSVLDPQKDEEVKGQASKVVFFSNLPREDEKKKELLTIAERFGIVEKHLFLTDQVADPSLTLSSIKEESLKPDLKSREDVSLNPDQELAPQQSQSQACQMCGLGGPSGVDQ